MSIAQRLVNFSDGLSADGVLSAAKGGTGNTTGGGTTSPTISQIGYGGDDTATDVAGGGLITLSGTNFASGAKVLINTTPVGVVTVVSSTQITFTAPALAAGSYILYVVNLDGSTAIAVPGIQYSGVPAWSTAAGTLGTGYETSAVSSTVSATSNSAVTYSVVSGTLPTGVTINASGTISGTSPLVGGSTTYTFTVRATDAENQDTDRSFSLTINPDVVTWSSSNTIALPQNVASTTTLAATSAAGQAISYATDTLPPGLTRSGATVSGTPTAAGTTTTVATATAAVTGKTAQQTITWTVSIAADTYFPLTTLLLNSETVALPFLADASTNNFAVTAVGDTKPSNFNPYTPGYYSNYFDGSGDFLTFTGSPGTTLTGNFTVEAWVYLNTVSATQPILCIGDDFGNPGVMFFVDSTGKPAIVYANARQFTGTGTIAANTWAHVAFVRSGTTVTGYLNGVSQGTLTTSNTFSGTTSYIGKEQYNGGTGAQTSGYISNLRIVNGTALYTTTFTPSTTPLTAVAGTSLLTCQSNRLIDLSTNAYTMTKTGDVVVNSFDPFVPNTSYSTLGSTYFDGTGDYLTVPTNSAFSLTGNFTLECWLYPTAFSNYRGIWSGTNVVNSTGFHFGLNSAGNIFIYANSSFTVTSSNAMTLNTWNHVAVVRNSGIIYIYINGILSTNSWTTSTSFTNAACVIGTNPGPGTEYYVGSISDFRIVNGTAVYTAAFTPPSAPLTAITNTSLLTCQTNQPTNNQTFLDNSTNAFPITRTGGVKQGSFSPYGANWSNYFDGSSRVAFPTGTFSYWGTKTTIEMWIFPTAVTGGYGYNGLLANQDSSGATGQVGIFNKTTGSTFVLAVYSPFLNANKDSTITGNMNQWNHVVVQIDCTTPSAANELIFYINGVREVTTINFNTLTSTGYTATPLCLAGDAYYHNYFTGFISNARVVQGSSYVYTGATITPPTTPLTPTLNTILLTAQTPGFTDTGPLNKLATLTGTPSTQKFNPFATVTQTPNTHSVYFDGTGDYLSTAYNSAFNVAGGTFTIEAWVNITGTFPANGDTNRLGAIAVFGPATVSQGWEFSIDQTNNTLFFNAMGSSSNLVRCSYTFAQNTWYHIAMVRNGSTNYLFVNGISQTLTVNGYTGGSAGSGTLNVGAALKFANYNHYITGYISNFRIVNGTALYTANFTPPTTPLTAVTNTQLLTCQDATFKDNSTNQFALTAFGDAKPRQQNPFGYTTSSAQDYSSATFGGSVYLDGNGDFLTTSTNTAFAFGTGDFTVEFWTYIDKNGDNRYTEFSAGGLLYSSGSGSVGPMVYYVGGARISSSTLSLYTWYHVALVRSSGTTKLYLNGTQAGSSYTDATDYGTAATNIVIGTDRGSNTQFLQGYMSDLRITKGTAVYKANFVPPTAPLTAVTNTTLLLNMDKAAIADKSGKMVLETFGDAKTSTAIKKYGTASMSFDGSGDGLYCINNEQLKMGTGDYTVEFWMYQTSAAGNQVILEIGRATTTAGVGLQIDTVSGSLTVYYGPTIATAFASGVTPTLNSWNHIAMTRQSGSTKFFVNGVQAGSAFTDNTNYTQATLWLGSNAGAGSAYFSGYIDDLRITKGYARYTANFTPPSSALLTK